MARIPRPLLIVVLVLVMLGAVSCAAGGMKGPPDIDDVDLEFDPAPIAASEIDTTGNCTRLDAEITVTTNCDLIVPAQNFPPRELRLLVTNGPVTVTVIQKVRGQFHTKASKPPIGEGERFEVSAAGERDVRVGLFCLLGCGLEILP